MIDYPNRKIKINYHLIDFNNKIQEKIILPPRSETFIKADASNNVKIWYIENQEIAEKYLYLTC